MLLASASFSADSPRPSPPLSLSLRLDLPLSALCLASQVFGQYRLQALEPAGEGEFRRRDLGPLDRPFAGRYDRRAALTSDIAIFAWGAVPVALSARDYFTGAATLPEAGSETAIYAQALTLNSGLNLLVRSLRIHPRPLVYGEEAPLEERRKNEAAGSFYSGHASSAFVVAAFLPTVAAVKGKPMPGRWLGLGFAGALGISWLRVEAGKHFPSDVLAGAAAGSCFGWALPHLHRSRVRLLPHPEGRGLSVVMPLSL